MIAMQLVGSLGIVGYGRISATVAKLLQNWDVDKHEVRWSDSATLAPQLWPCRIVRCGRLH